MGSLFWSTCLKIAFPGIAIGMILLASKRRGFSWADDLGLKLPPSLTMLLWLGGWVGWIALSEVLIRLVGLEQAKAWPAYPPLIIGMRILAIGIAGPIAEEIVMRGFVLHLLRRTAVGTPGAVAIVAIGWAALHYTYDPGTIALIAVDGAILGIARVSSGSLVIPMVLHAVGNLFSIYQSLTP